MHTYISTAAIRAREKIKFIYVLIVEWDLFKASVISDEVKIKQ